MLDAARARVGRRDRPVGHRPAAPGVGTRRRLRARHLACTRSQITASATSSASTVRTSRSTTSRSRPIASSPAICASRSTSGAGSISSCRSRSPSISTRELGATFVASLARHGDAVLFSAAIPFQGGAGHVNEHWPSYWAADFAVHGFVAVDTIRPARVERPEGRVLVRAEHDPLRARRDGRRPRHRGPIARRGPSRSVDAAEHRTQTRSAAVAQPHAARSPGRDETRRRAPAEARFGTSTMADTSTSESTTWWRESARRVTRAAARRSPGQGTRQPEGPAPAAGTQADLAAVPTPRRTDHCERPAAPHHRRPRRRAHRPAGARSAPERLLPEVAEREARGRRASSTSAATTASTRRLPCTSSRARASSAWSRARRPSNA